METTKVIISPKTKILELIETYPKLESILISYVPAFTKLKNPLLRKTVAKITTLQQAALIGNVKVEDLINLLRKEVGQDMLKVEQSNEYNYNKPESFDESMVVQELDAREMLARGEHPVNQVIAELRQLPDSKAYKLVAPFLPAPLIDKSLSLNYKHWIKKEQADLFIIYFFK